MGRKVSTLKVLALVTSLPHWISLFNTVNSPLPDASGQAATRTASNRFKSASVPNDVGGRIHDAGRAGYEFVEEDDDGRSVKVSRRVGTNEDGSAMIAYLMEIRQEFYDEDQAVKQSRLDEIDAQITRKDVPMKSDAEDADKFYSGAGSSITVRN